MGQPAWRYSRADIQRLLQERRTEFGVAEQQLEQMQRSAVQPKAFTDAVKFSGRLLSSLRATKQKLEAKVQQQRTEPQQGSPDLRLEAKVQQQQAWKEAGMLNMATIYFVNERDTLLSLPAHTQMPNEIFFFVRMRSSLRNAELPQLPIAPDNDSPNMTTLRPPLLQQFGGYLHVARVHEGHEAAGPMAQIQISEKTVVGLTRDHAREVLCASSRVKFVLTVPSTPLFNPTLHGCSLHFSPFTGGITSAFTVPVMPRFNAPAPPAPPPVPEKAELQEEVELKKGKAKGQEAGLKPAGLLSDEGCLAKDAPTPAAEARKVVALVESVRAHPDEQRLSVCTVQGGAGASVQLVCGATNLKAGMLTVLAPLGSCVTKHADGSVAIIKAAKMRGVVSKGMLCGLGELGLLPRGAEAPKEVVVLGGGAKPGMPFEPSMLAAADLEDHDAKEEEEQEEAALQEAIASSLQVDDEMGRRALRNYEQFHGLKHGSATLSQVVGSSSGIHGWAQSPGATEGTSAQHQAEAEGWTFEDGREEEFEAVGEPAPPPPPSDAKEAADIQRALLASVGVKFGGANVA